MRKRIFQVSAAISSTCTILATVAGILASNRLMYVKKKDEELILERETSAKRYDEVWYANVKKEERQIESENGYNVHAIFLEPHDTDKYVVICHGVTETKVNSFKYARMFEELGFNSVVYDHRRHGGSGGKTTSFGHYEKFDLKAVVDMLKEHAGPDLVFGIHGESMGAATTLLYAGMRDDAAFYISDCGYSDISEQILHVMQTTTPLKTPITLKLAAFFMKLRDGYHISTVTPREAVKQIEKPVLFIHSLPDDFVLPEMSIEMHSLKEGPKALKLFEKGGHAQSFNENPLEYKEAVSTFLMEQGIFPAGQAPENAVPATSDC
ncbi:alpha/beta hydrolase [Planococcus halotolerans]|uniref:Alpha/beta hydrolase n=1 Tax=Planococcus halotolerans TaxID=2233542 RepID=A0A365L1T3_9BACL|nr:alpha/beta hydrolase [Planococcus halotolerans]QHJ71084.1 alpha/beta fold hydrolase [Planococcus halotolerans]RAZ79155.1 alpha/beta hydrolase [Planococcus halotolerans]